MNNVITKRELLVEVFKLLIEKNDIYRVSWETFMEYEREMIYKVVREIENNKKNEHWRLIPFGRLKRIWENYMKFNFIRDEKGMNMIKEICVTNIARLLVNTTLVGHTQDSPRDYLEDHEFCFLEKQEKKPKPVDPNQLKLFKNPEATPEPEKKYDDYCTQINLTWEQFENRLDRYIGDGTFSDFALQPLLELGYDLIDAKTPEEQLRICDAIFNVVHTRSDIAGLFVQGGSNALTQLSGEHAEVQNYRA